MSATKKHLAATAETKICRWTACRPNYDEDGVWETDCGEAFQFVEDGPAENNMKFCCYCGGELVEVPHQESEARDE